MKEKKQIKIGLSTVIYLILMIAVIIGIAISRIIGVVRSKNYKNVYDLKIPNDFVSMGIMAGKNYQYVGGIKYSVENADEAIEYIIRRYNKYEAQGSELLNLTVDNEDFYYSVFKSYKNNYNGVTYNNTYIFFKRDIIDIEDKQINLSNINNKDEIKKIFNTYFYAYNYENRSYKIEKSKIKEYINKYVYTIYFYEISYGDWGLNDHIKRCKQNIVINKKDGKYTIENKKIMYEFEGNFNSGPDPF